MKQLTTAKLRVACGILMRVFSMSLVTTTWHPSRELFKPYQLCNVWEYYAIWYVSVSPNAISSISFSSSSGSLSFLYISLSRITWHVEQAKEPSQAPAPEDEKRNTKDEITNLLDQCHFCELPEAEYHQFSSLSAPSHRLNTPRPRRRYRDIK